MNLDLERAGRAPARAAVSPRRFVAIALAGLTIFFAAPAGGAGIPWDPEVKYSRTSVDDDLRNILRSLLKANGFSAVFAPGVDARVSFQFHEAKPSVVFEKLIAAHDLSYAFDADARTVTITSNRAGLSGSDGHRFLSLRNIDFDTLRDALKRFGIAVTGLAYEPRLGLVSIRGNEAEIERVETLVEALEARAVEREQEYFERVNRRRSMRYPPDGAIDHRATK